MQSQSALLKRAAVVFLPLAVLMSCLTGMVYLVAQQGLRSGADELPQQLAVDAAAALDAGAEPATVVAGGAWAGNPQVDLATSLSPFMVVFDHGTKVLATNAQLDGGDPIPPAGVLAAAASNRPNRVTWQPRPGVRIATVSARWTGGTVLAGRSLREVERREDLMLQLSLLGWAGSLAAVGVASLIAAALWQRLSQRA
jgi:hypothetical protein